MSKTALTISAILHIMFAIALSFANVPQEKRKPDQKITLHSSDTDPRKSESKKDIIVPKGSNGAISCKDWYGGIGVNHNSECTIIIIAPGYPAYKAGLKVGDRLESLPNGNCPGRGDPGTIATVGVIQKNGRVIYRSMVRDKICIDN